ncbi:MAG: phospholipase [Variovorax paradoxus]|nr:MAG: phospholipase [Variovorax paradoxus]PZQ10953.1 MAG: phospholipase [Variovorax paradoxus]
MSNIDTTRILQSEERAFWRVEEATQAAVIVDADDYFVHLRSAMLKARRRIILVGWDFDARISLAEDLGDGAPATIGRFISWLVKRRPELDVYILRWATGALETLLHARTVLAILRWTWDPRIHLKFDGHHPLGGSHHQKIAVIDESLAFCGGIDMTRNRWDTRGHLDNEPRRINPNGQPYGPWHDATTALEGPVARALGEMCRKRWEGAGGDPLEPIEAGPSCWPDRLTPDFTNVSVGISRTLPAMGDHEAIHEIEELYVTLIKRAKRWIYAESQYFASRHIAEAIAQRLHEENGPEVVIVNPTTAEGWLEPVAMDTARARLVAALRDCDSQGRFRIYHPFTAGGVPIYVHAKVMVIDDEVLRVGSSNFNNRSLRLDSECDVSIDANSEKSGAVGATIAGIRNALLAEHLGTDCGTIERALHETGSLIATIEALRRPGRTLRDYQLPELAPIEQWLADTKLLDPEGPDERFEAPARRVGLLSRLRHHPWKRTLREEAPAPSA